jgi:hypothetical protein
MGKATERTSAHPPFSHPPFLQSSSDEPPHTSAKVTEATRALKKGNAQIRGAGALISPGPPYCLYSPLFTGFREKTLRNRR